jgi:hypothetical protein
VKVKSGNFGTTANVEAADFSAAGDATGTPCIFGSNSNDGDWLRLDLPASMLPYINHTATTQFIISAPGVTGGKTNFFDASSTTFYGGSNTDFAPVLNMAYGQTPNGVKEVTDLGFSIYPNPSTGLLTIEKGAEIVTHIEVANMLGEVVLHPQIQQNTIDISTLPAGMYVVNIITKNGRVSEKVVKE